MNFDIKLRIDREILVANLLKDSSMCDFFIYKSLVILFNQRVF